ncbi:MAG: formate dehydrogenase [Deltaproteobacteria bacterium RBG_13_43_22]|nr:MAG: formate dehydrogenase [Deltaproteobacteria bacterium RBG_13_43_22]
MTNSIAEIEQSKVILITGSNTTENHPVIGAAVKRAVLQHGAKLILVDPRKIELTEIAHLWLRPRPGTDLAWINGLIHILVQENLLNTHFIQERTEGFEELKAAVSAFTPSMVSKITGIPEKDLFQAARLYAGDRAAIYYTMGITQHSHGTDNVMALANLAMVCGNVGFPGTGINPLRGQNNVQGACDVGGLPNVFSGYQSVGDPVIIEKMEKAWGVKGLSDKPGLTLMEITEGAKNKKIHGLYIFGENPVVSDPDTHHLTQALKAVDFLVVQDIFLTETAQLAHVVLPGASFAEKEGTFTNTERRVQRVRQAISPLGEAKPDWQIITELSNRMGLPMAYENPEAVFEEMRSLTPAYAGITYQRINRAGIQWPCPTLDHPGTPYLHQDRFTRGLGKFHALIYRGPIEVQDAEYPLVLTTGRILYHYHTGTMTRKSKGLEEMAPECLIEISSADARTLKLSEGERVKVVSRRGDLEAGVKITDRSPQGVIFIPFHYAEAAANRLTQTALDPVAKIPELKVCAVRIEKL